MRLHVRELIRALLSRTWHIFLNFSSKIYRIINVLKNSIKVRYFFLYILYYLNDILKEHEREIIRDISFRNVNCFFEF